MALVNLTNITPSVADKYVFENETFNFKQVVKDGPKDRVARNVYVNCVGYEI